MINRFSLITYVSLLSFFYIHDMHPQEHVDIIVDSQGHGDYKTITEAIDALPMYPYQRTVIFVKNGIYEEKLRIEQNYITLHGESRENTIIHYNQRRENWDKNRDYIGPAVINLEGDDIILNNLTIENSQPEIGPHAFAIYDNSNRTIIINCNVLSKGGDTVSLWNYKYGMYYLSNCFFQGAVDFVCPRGWCFIRDSEFYEVSQTAAIWHAGNYLPEQKFVIRNSYFDGVPGFELGRHHYEAQFYLLDCRFSENMADKPIYKVMDKNPDRNNPYFGGERKYYYNCQKTGQAYEWYKDNLEKADGRPESGKITAAWTFGGKWDPESKEPLVVTHYQIEGKILILTFNEIVTVRGKPVFMNKSGKPFTIVMQRFNDINRVMFTSDSNILPEDLTGELILEEGNIISSIASVHERSIGTKFSLNQR